MTLAQAIDEIAESPEFFDVLEEFQQRGAEEQAARNRYTNSLGEEGRKEFIAGKVVALMPTQQEHDDVLHAIRDAAKTFARLSVGGQFRTEQGVIRTKRNDYMPDLCWWPKAKAKAFRKDQVIYTVPPAWIVEIVSPATESRDRGEKLRDYAAHGVVEYWIGDADEEFVDQYENRDGTFVLVKRHTAGKIRGIAMPGFLMPVRAAFDEAANSRFIEQLWAAKAKKK